MANSKTSMQCFFSKVDIPDYCWIWLGCRDHDGYGGITVNKKTLRSSRWIFEQVIGPIPKGMLICHTCDNPSCVNPRHLFFGTSKDNMLDALKKGRLKTGPRKTHCIRGHEMNEKNAPIIKTKGYFTRMCILCRRINSREYYLKNKIARNYPGTNRGPNLST